MCSSDLNEPLYEQIREAVCGQQTLIVVPVYSGEKALWNSASIKSRDTIQILVREVGRE